MSVDLHPLAARGEALPPLAGADHRLARLSRCCTSLVLGFGLGPVFQKAGQGSYLQFIAPGVIGMTILFTSIFSGIGLLWDRQFGFLKETLVAPVPRLQIMIGRTLGGATVAHDPGHAGAHRLPDRGLPAAQRRAACPLGAAVHGADRDRLRRARHGHRLDASQDMQGFQLIMNFLVMPIFFLSGALFPLRNLPAAAHRRDAPRSAVVRRRRAARRAHRPVALRHGHRSRGARGRGGRLHGARRLVVLAHPDLTATREAPPERPACMPRPGESPVRHGNQ